MVRWCPAHLHLRGLCLDVVCGPADGPGNGIEANHRGDHQPCFRAFVGARHKASQPTSVAPSTETLLSWRPRQEFVLSAVRNAFADLVGNCAQKRGCFRASMKPPKGRGHPEVAAVQAAKFPHSNKRGAQSMSSTRIDPDRS